MRKYEEIYIKLSKLYFLLHALVLLLVLIASILPFRGDENFYQVFHNYKGQALVMLGLLFISCLMSYVAIKMPLFSILVVPFSYAFFVMMMAPYLLEGAKSYIENMGGLNANQSLDTFFGAGFDLMNFVSRVTILETPFMVYAIVVSVLKRRDKRAQKRRK